MDVLPNTIAVWSDLGCPWSHVVVWRLHDARRRLGLESRVHLDHHAFPLELFNNEPTPFRTRAAEWPVAAQLAPRAGWAAWSAPVGAWPGTMLPPMEAGRARRSVLDDWAVARGDEVRGSAHLFAPGGTNAQNPGITIGWHENEGGGFATIEGDDPAAVESLVRL